MIYIPECVKKIVGTRPYAVDDIGKSNSNVLIFDDYVLKIQPISGESENERQVCDWAKGKLPIPEILVYHIEDGTLYELMTRVKGEMLCSEDNLKKPEEIIRLTAEALKLFWAVDPAGCPALVSPLDDRLRQARKVVEAGEADTNVEPETYGPGGFSGPEELIDWLDTHRPAEDIVLTHGDFCLPNIFAEDGQITGFIDLGKMGPADRWQDIAIAIRTLHHNFSGYYGGAPCFPQFTPQMLLDQIGIPMDAEKYRYYILLDELA